jgi:hypothetical protein
VKPPRDLRPTLNRFDGAHRKRQDAYNAWMKSLVEKIDATDTTDALLDSFVRGGAAGLELTAEGKVKVISMKDFLKPPEEDTEK